MAAAAAAAAGARRGGGHPAVQQDLRWAACGGAAGARGPAPGAALPPSRPPGAHCHTCSLPLQQRGRAAGSVQRVRRGAACDCVFHQQGWALQQSRCAEHLLHLTAVVACVCRPSRTVKPLLRPGRKQAACIGLRSGSMHAAQGMACLSSSQLAAVLRSRASLLFSDAADLMPRIDWLRGCVPVCHGSGPPSKWRPPPAGVRGCCAPRPAASAAPPRHPDELCYRAGRWPSVRPPSAHPTPMCDAQHFSTAAAHHRGRPSNVTQR